MKVRVINTLDDLAADTRRVATRARGDMVGVVRDGVRTGATVARDNARRTAGAHGKHYPRSIDSEMLLHGALGLIAGEWGPLESKRQGRMSFEGGSRNQKPHRDIAKSADLVAPAYYAEVARLPARWFW